MFALQSMIDTQHLLLSFEPELELLRSLICYLVSRFLLKLHYKKMLLLVVLRQFLVDGCSQFELILLEEWNYKINEVICQRIIMKIIQNPANKLQQIDGRKHRNNRNSRTNRTNRKDYQNAKQKQKYSEMIYHYILPSIKQKLELEQNVKYKLTKTQTIYLFCHYYNYHKFFLFCFLTKISISILMSSIFSDSTVSDEEPPQNQKLNNAYQLLLTGKEQEAIILYLQIIQENPKLWRAYQNLGVAYIITKKFEQAFEVLYKYVKHVPKDPLGHDSLGVSYSQLNDPLQAICSFVNSINLNPNYYMSYYNLGVVLGKLNLNEMALNIYKKCVQLNPYYVNALNNIGDLYKKFSQVDIAIQYFKTVLQIDPNYSLAIKNLGNCFFSQKRYAEALIFYTKYLEFSEHQSVFLNLAVCYDHFKLYREAGVQLMKAYMINPQLAERFDRCFLSGCLYFRQLHKIAAKIRLLVQAGKKISTKVARQFFLFYESSLNCFLRSSNLFPQYKQSLQNVQKLKFNVFGYCAKTGGIYQDLLKLQMKLLPQKNIQKMFKRQRQILQKIKFWRRLTKKIIISQSWEKRKIKKNQQTEKQNQQDEVTKKKNSSQNKNQEQIIHVSQEDIDSHRNEGGLINQFFEPNQSPLQINMNELKKQSDKQPIQQHVYKIANRRPFDSQRLKFIRKRYISRTRNHNFKRLILKRSNFIKKYNIFNSEIESFFKLKRMSTSVSEPSQSSVNVVNLNLNLQGAQIDNLQNIEQNLNENINGVNEAI